MRSSRPTSRQARLSPGPTAVAIALAIAAAGCLLGPGGPVQARAEDGEAKVVWQSISFAGKRVGWVRMSVEATEDGGHRVERVEEFRLPRDETPQQARNRFVAEAGPDWKVRSYTFEVENLARHHRDTVTVADGKLEGRREDLAGGGEPKFIFQRAFAYDGGLGVTHPFELASTTLEVGLEKQLLTVDLASERARPLRYRVVEKVGDEAFRVIMASPLGVEVEYLVRASDGMPIEQATRDSGLYYVAVPDEAAARDLDAPGAWPAHDRGLGIELRDGVLMNYMHGYSLRWAGLPWMIERTPRAEVALTDLARDARVFIRAFAGLPDDMTLAGFTERLEKRNAARAQEYEAIEHEQIQVGELPGRAIRGRLSLPSGAREFLNVYLKSGDRAWEMQAIVQPGLLESLYPDVAKALQGFKPLDPEAIEPRVEGNTARDAGTGVTATVPEGWKILLAPIKANAPPNTPRFRLRRGEAAEGFVTVTRVPLGMTLDDMEALERTDLKRKFRTVTDVTVEQRELGGRRVLEVRGVVKGGGENVVTLRAGFLDGGNFYGVVLIVKSPEAAKQVREELDAILKSIGPWSPG